MPPKVVFVFFLVLDHLNDITQNEPKINATFAGKF